MSALTEKIRRKTRNGGVLDTVPENATVKPGSLKIVDGKRYMSLTDGRIVRMPIEVVQFVGGRVLRTVVG